MSPKNVNQQLKFNGNIICTILGKFIHLYNLLYFSRPENISVVYIVLRCAVLSLVSRFTICGYFFVLAWYNRLCVLLYCVLWRGFVQREVEMYYNPLVRISHMARSARPSFSPTAARRGVSTICRDGVILERAFPQAARWR